MVSGIFGGSFNPFHTGHLEIIRQVLSLDILDRLFVVPAYVNPIKQSKGNTPEAVRWEMLERCLRELPKVELLDFEIKRPEKSYTWQTLEYLQSQYPEDRFKILMGQDTFELFYLWKKREWILNNSHLVVFERLQSGEKKKESTDFDEQCERIQLDLPEISSTLIRDSPLRKVEEMSWLPPAALPVWKQFVLARKGASC